MKHTLVVFLASATVACGQVQFAFTNFAGMPGGPGSVDGIGSVARFWGPAGVAVDKAGNIYVADGTIRKSTPDGLVTTVATGLAANGIAVDSAGNIYVTETANETIRKITADGVITRLAGSDLQLGSADGTGSMARFNSPRGVAVDSAGNVYVADTFNHTIRKITPDGVVTTLAGSAGEGGSDDGTGSAARFRCPEGVAVDNAGNVYVADSVNQTIRKITPGGVVTTLAGNASITNQFGPIGGYADGTGSAARFDGPAGVTVDSAGDVYVAEFYNETIRKIDSAGVVTTLAGSAGQQGSADGTGTAARFFRPQGVAVDSTGNAYVADTGNHTIRKITPLAAVTTLAGSAEHPGSANGTGSAARFTGPFGVAVDGGGNVYVADTGNHTIRKITPLGAVTTLAGSAGQFGGANGTGGAARFSNPSGVAVDSAGSIYVADTANHTIRKITPLGAVTTLAGSAERSGSADGTGSAARFNGPYGVAVDTAGNAYVADTGNHTIRKITPLGAVTTVAGRAGQSGSDDGAGSAARFDLPHGVAADSDGRVYVADYLNNTIRKVTPGGEVTTLTDGTGSDALFYEPAGVATDPLGNVYVADLGNNSIRKITPAGAVTTLAGSAGQIGGADGIGSAAQFYYPYGVAVDSAGNVYVADTFNNRITKGTPVASPEALKFVTGSGSLTLSNGVVRMRLTGSSGSNVVLEVSGNLQAWAPVQTNALLPTGLDLSVPVGTSQRHFFRARRAP